jgi:dipeptidyl aminopeptidase/acylaminoacyl peptidase
MRRSSLAVLLFLGLAAPAHAAFPGANGRIVFTSANRLDTVGPGGGPWTRLLSDDTRQGQPAWAPDGSKVAFRVGPDGDSEIWVVNADGTGAHAITDTPNPGGDPRYSSQPAWSPDGSRIVLRSDRRDNNPDVWVMNADGTNPQPLVTTPGDERYPALSPDGSKLVYRSDVDGDPEIYVAAADGTGAVKLTDNTLFDSAPAWSPDSRRIAFERGDPGADVPANSSYASMELWTMDADGTHQQPLTSNAVHDEGPAWAPDGGAALVFTRDDKTNSDLWIHEADGSERRLTDAPSLEESPDWQAVPRAPAGAPVPAPTTPAATPASTTGTTLASRRVRLSRTGRLTVKVRCAVACTGRLVLLRDRKRLAAATFTGPGSVRLRVGPKTLRRVRRALALRAVVRGGVTGSVTLLRPRPA